MSIVENILLIMLSFHVIFIIACIVEIFKN